MLVVEQDIGHTIANVLCSHSVCLQKPQTRTARMTTQEGPSGRLKKVMTCFVLDDSGGNFETFVNTAGEWSQQTDTFDANNSHCCRYWDGNIIGVDAVGVEPRSSEDKHRSGWNTRFKGGTYSGMLYGVVLRVHLPRRERE